MARHIACLLFFVVSVVLKALPVGADVISTSGSVLAISPPPSIANGQLTSSTYAHLFQEKAGFVLGADLWVDVTSPGQVQIATDLTPGIIPAGTKIDSYFLMSDTPTSGRGGTIVTFAGTITFDTPVLGVIVTTQRLALTDATLGANSTSYLPSNDFRGFDGPTFSSSTIAVADMMVLSANRRTISFEFKSEFYNDQIRLITAVVPEPATFILTGSVIIVFPLRRSH